MGPVMSLQATVKMHRPRGQRAASYSAAMICTPTYTLFHQPADHLLVLVGRALLAKDRGVS